MSDEQLREVAREVFHEHGAQAPLSAVAERLGVSTAAVLHRVGSKARLLELVLAPAVPPALLQLAGAPGPEPRRELEALLVDLAHSLEELVPSLVVRRAAPATGPEVPGVLPPPVVLRRALTRWLKRTKTVVPAGVAAEALLGPLEARAFNRYLGGEAFAPGSDRALIRALVNGLVAP